MSVASKNVVGGDVDERSIMPASRLGEYAYCLAIYLHSLLRFALGSLDIGICCAVYANIDIVFGNVVLDAITVAYVQCVVRRSMIVAMRIAWHRHDGAP